MYMYIYIIYIYIFIYLLKYIYIYIYIYVICLVTHDIGGVNVWCELKRKCYFDVVCDKLGMDIAP